MCVYIAYNIALMFYSCFIDLFSFSNLAS